MNCPQHHWLETALSIYWREQRCSDCGEYMHMDCGHWLSGPHPAMQVMRTDLLMFGSDDIKVTAINCRAPIEGSQQ